MERWGRIGKVARRLTKEMLFGSQPEKILEVILAETEGLSGLTRLRFLRKLSSTVGRREISGGARVEYAGALLPEDRRRLESSFSIRVGRDVHLKPRKNQSLIAGIRVSIGDRRWEYSIGASFRRFIGAEDC
ncbi:MAG: F0F1 ATP synthase subunit delta [Puniceicoccales bacterium]|jgi:hypothetical protein|nr:F0F1 ATP synthase subunit delta [Puniceicoccales bacterium]